MTGDDNSIELGVLTYLADNYRPVMSEWIEAVELATALSLPIESVEACCAQLQQRGLIEMSPPDEENEHAAALITVKGLLAIGRVP
jgi:hypothetical protein